MLASGVDEAARDGVYSGSIASTLRRQTRREWSVGEGDGAMGGLEASLGPVPRRSANVAWHILPSASAGDGRWTRGSAVSAARRKPSTVRSGPATQRRVVAQPGCLRHGDLGRSIVRPFCRTPEEGTRVLETMKEGGLVRGERGLLCYGMAEIPSNIILAAEFAKLFDGFSIGPRGGSQSGDLWTGALGLSGVRRVFGGARHRFDQPESDALVKTTRRVLEVERALVK